MVRFPHEECASPNDINLYTSWSLDQHDVPEKKPRSTSVRRLAAIICGIMVLVAVIVAVGVTLTADSSSSGDTPSSSGSSATSAASSTRLSSCPPVAAKDRTVAFWQSEVAGCDTVPDGVTHLIFGFALVAEGVIVPTFQSSDDHITQCVKTLHERCISTLASVGGSTNNDNMSVIANATLFAESAVNLVTKFGFAGLDFDDETVGVQFSADRTIELLKATREALDESGGTSSALLTYDAYFSEGDLAVCSAVDAAVYSRCFPTKVLDYVDWINIMAYNVHEDDATAAAIYAAAENTTFAAWKTQLGGDFSRATVGLCVKGGCAYGPGPNATVINEWEKFGRQDGHGGMMIYSASAEVGDNFAVTRSIIRSS
ncbi:unnamed protein product [Hyaloperonospora brassicae]|uniref:GH18 domain-containing protein n=1 Tax=Hyaloperonospora brassicae TaxID=162125 RepID=A0AAV0TK58_HYABA|nr:unnamed protein product [Hyaloperonospora brassicae]